MIRLVGLGVLLFVAQLTVNGQANSTATPPNSTPTVTISRSTFEKAKLAFDEVRVSRRLIDAQASEIETLKENIRLRIEADKLKNDIIELKTQQLAEKEKAINAAQEKSSVAEKRVGELQADNVKLAEKLRAANKRTKIAAGAAFVLGVVTKMFLF